MQDLQLSSLFDVSGLSIAITGGAGVLGAAMTRGLLANGATVTLLVRSPEKAAALQAECASLPGQLHLVRMDVTDAAGAADAIAECKARAGRLDALVNAAGGNKPGATALPPERLFFDLPDGDLRDVIDLNLMGTVIPSQAAGRVFAEQGHGHIINISSMAAIKPLTRVVGYSAAKAAITNFTTWLSVHMCQNYGAEIRVNAIAPGFFLTEQNRFLLTDKETGALTARGQTIIDHTPMGRFGEPDELVGTLIWLLSSSSRFVTGAIIPVDGGFSAFGGV